MPRLTYIAGSTVSLAEFLDEDYFLYYETWLDPETRRNFNSQGSWKNAEECLQFFTNPDRPPQRMNAAILASDEVVGRISLAPSQLEPDLGIWVYVGSRGKGYGTEAVSLATQYIFDTTDLTYIVAGIYGFNSAGKRIFERAGFKRAPELDEAEESAFGEGDIVQLGYRLSRL
jgi:RimJ/RimL family protein N-acetyltransferase